jgi:hypothetical protein
MNKKHWLADQFNVFQSPKRDEFKKLISETHVHL